MPIGSEVLDGSYMGELLSRFPAYTEEDFWALICCGSDLHHPYDGWSGVVAIPIFSARYRPFELFFGDFPDSLAQYENVPDYLVNRDISKYQAFSEFRSFIEACTDNPVFISANASTWALKIVNEAVRLDSSGAWNAQFICLRDVYSLTRSSGDLCSSEFIGSAFRLAPALSKRFGLHAIADALDISEPDSSNRALHRARLTAAVSRRCLDMTYPS